MHAVARPEPPMPRSQQLLQAQAAAAAGMPVQVPPPRPQPLSAAPRSMIMAPPQLPQLARAPSMASIDYGKYKTKLCRNYLMGQPCPFESRCAFAHGEEQLQREIEAAQLHHQQQQQMRLRTPGSTTSAYEGSNSSASMEFPMSAPQYQQQHHYAAGSYHYAGNSSDDESTPMAPPTYESFLATTSYLEPASPIDSDPATPVAPVRYRHDPYSMEGIIFKYF